MMRFFLYGGKMLRVTAFGFSLFQLVVGVYLFVSAIMIAVHAYAPIPHWDQWIAITLEEHVRFLFVQHNEHRVFFPRLAFMFDVWALSGRNTFNLAMIFLVQIFHLWLLVTLARRSGLVGSTKLVGLVGIAAATMFWGHQSENFVWGFQVQFVGVYAAATAAFASLALAGTNSRFWLAVGAAVVAAFSMANGLVVAVLLTAQSALLRHAWRETVGLGVLSIALSVTYFGAYETPRGFEWQAQVILEHLIYVPVYVVVFLGGALGVLSSHIFYGSGITVLEQSRGVAAAFGVLGLVMTLGFLGLMMVRRQFASPSRIALVFVLLFVVATAVMIALGRVHLSVDQAMSQRYGTPSLVFWLALTILAWSLCVRPGSRWSWLVPVIVTGPVLGFAWTQTTFLNEAMARRLTTQSVETAMLAGAADLDVLSKVTPVASAILPRIETLKQLSLSVFAEPWSQWRGRPLNKVADITSTEACSGYLDEAIEVPISAGRRTSWRVRGWAWDRGAQRPARRIVLTDDRSIVVGYGLGGSPRPDVWAAVPEVTTATTGWSGHAAAEPPALLRAYALLRGGTRACPLAGTFRSPPT